jgi:ACS family glucarate transporter-like MFS transporter
MSTVGEVPIARGAYVPVRFRILGLLVVLSFVNYLLRNNMSIAAPGIREEFGFSQEGIGWIFLGFNTAYALLQIPGGIFGQIFGARRTLAWITVSWGVLTFLTGFLPALFATSVLGTMVSLIAVRFLLGVTNAPVYPAVAGAIERWFPPGSWAFPNAASSVGLSLGQAVLGPLVAVLMVTFGWRESFYFLAPIGILAGLWWYWYGRDTPAEHPAVTRAERELIDGGRGTQAQRPCTKRDWGAVLGQRDVLLLACAYFCSNYVFYIFANWLFTYLVEERHFSLLESGWLSAAPFVVGGVLGVVGGVVCDVLCRKIGPRWGCALPASVALLLVAGFLFSGAYAANAYVAVTLLSLCFGFTLFLEGPFWSATTYAAGPNACAASGVVNTGGNLPGLIAPLFGFMIDHLGWLPTLASGSLFALLGAVLWLFVGAQRRPGRTTARTSKGRY